MARVIDRLTERNSSAFPLIHEGEATDLGFEERGAAEERDRERQPHHSRPARRSCQSREGRARRAKDPQYAGRHDAAAADGIASWELEGIDLDTHFPLTVGAPRSFEGFDRSKL